MEAITKFFKSLVRVDTTQPSEIDRCEGCDAQLSAEDYRICLDCERTVLKGVGMVVITKDYIMSRRMTEDERAMHFPRHAKTSQLVADHQM